jgi:hypothetical protein
MRVLEIGRAGHIAIGQIPRLFRIVVPCRGRRDLGKEQAHRDAAERRDLQVHRIADRRRSRRYGDRILSGKGQLAVRSGNDVRSRSRERDMRAADYKRELAVFIGHHDPYAIAANTCAPILADGLIAHGARYADGGEEIGVPDGLRARSPGRDPGTVLGSERLARGASEACRTDGQCAENEIANKRRSLTMHSFPPVISRSCRAGSSRKISKPQDQL